MSNFNIEYLDSLPKDIDIINIVDKYLVFFPSLKRFSNLKTLYYQYNQLTSLPSINSFLEKIYCLNRNI